MSDAQPSVSSARAEGRAANQLRPLRFTNGIAPSGMPAWKGILDDNEMWNIVHYLRHLPPKGSLGSPDVYKEEAEEHEHMEGAAKGTEGKAGEQPKHNHTHPPGTPPHKD